MKTYKRRLSPLAAPLSLLAIYFLNASNLLADFSITEIKAVAELTGLDDDGEPSDWIEITNSGDSAASLEGYYLTNNSNDLTRWQLPDVKISAGRSIVIFAWTRVANFIL